MIQSNVNDASREFLGDFAELASSMSSFEAKGIFNSEMLLLYAVVRLLKVEKIIESGRARGQSTEMLARICREQNIEFHSVEFDEASPDASIAEARLKDFSDVCTLHYGDAFSLLPKLLDSKRTLIIIDGPKGSSALKLGLQVIKNSSVCGLFFHDAHRDALNIRPRLERYFKDALIVSDDYDFVKSFSNLDDECWAVTSAEFPGYAPYSRPGKRMRSYAGTLAGIAKNVDKNDVDEFLRDVEDELAVSTSRFYKALNSLRVLSALRFISRKLYISNE